MAEMMITISSEDFAGLVRDRHTLRLLVDVILGNATLGYGGEYLSFEMDSINMILKAVDYEAYNATLEGLKMSKKTTDKDTFGQYVPQPMD